MKKLLLYILLPVVLATGTQCEKSSSDSTTSTGSGGSTARFAIQGNYLYTVDKTNLKVYNITDVANPVLKNTVPVGFEIETIYPFKDKLFIGSTSVVYIFSVDDPENPKRLSTAVSPDVLRRCDPVVAKDTVAYATLRTNGPCGGIQSVMAAYDIKDISNPIQKVTYPVAEPYGLGYADSALYVCDRYGLYVFNIQKAFAPIMVKQIGNAWYLDVIPWNNTLICQMQDGLNLFDISNRLNPTLITKIN
ncbi:hypothetical protein A4D02_20805 [Niastella koreensis]|uniref:LVIVD repeat-containing protein n=2 Tax=Niastella koreensis TaxID=354356 RepID=G8TLP0_NIAKG|nr:LVIVD repeat-containing protein [Niastella koreensis]AEV96609.1 LVIVD repeat-containing protein [Niastella koreensis GR20-10]OQP54121.1 hypothetical protein A4D02_20805 [Niastella koreensis]